jgi:TIR domain-containing protein
MLESGLSFLSLILLFAVAAVPVWLIFRRTIRRRGFGVSSSIEKRKIGTQRPRPGKAIFISYRRIDSSDVTGRIYDRLVQHFGRENVFKDVDSIPVGVDFRGHLADSVGRCGVLLAVVGTRWMVRRAVTDDASLEDTRDFVRIEIESALEWHVPIIPVLVQGTTMPRESDLPETFRSFAYHNAISIRADPDFHQDCARLIRGIEFHINGKHRESHSN